MTTEAGARTGFGACAAAALCSVLMAGTGHLAVRARVRPSVFAAAIANIVATIAAIVIVAPVRGKTDLAEVIANRTVFLALGLALAVMAITRIFTALDSAWLARPADGDRLRLAAAVTAGALVVGGAAPFAIAADYVWQADRAVEKVFATEDAVTAFPSPLPTTTTITVGTTNTTAATTTTPTATTTTTPVPDIGQNRVNILLLGGDAGPGRYSLRTDSMIVVSIDSVTGDTVIISIPRNLERMPFPDGTALAKRYPKGFDDLANAVWTRVDQHRELVGGVDDAGSQAIKIGISQLLGIPIHNYVLVDMAGLVAVIDILGGIDINVTKRVPTPGNPLDAKHEVPSFFEIGEQHMDGTLALAYARTRSADSDYLRMARQQCMVGSIENALTPMAVALGLPDLVSAFGSAVQTDIPRQRLGEYAQLIERFEAAGGVGNIHTLHLGPPLNDPFRWRLGPIRELVASVLLPANRTADSPLLSDHC